MIIAKLLFMEEIKRVYVVNCRLVSLNEILLDAMNIMSLILC